MKLSIKKYINELQSIDLDLNWYFEDKYYQDIIDSQLSSILERLEWNLNKNSKCHIFEQIQSSLSNIQNISSKINFIIEFLTEELEGQELKSLSHSERHDLINKISCELQSSMVTTGINVFLSSFGVPTEDVDIVQSKRIYVQNLLKNVDSSIIVNIANELNIISDNSGITSVESMRELIKSHDLNSVLEDFNRALKNIENDPEQAIASSSSTLESICKAIIELDGQDLPKKQTIATVLAKAVAIVNINPKNHSDSEIKRILGGIQNVILGLGALRSGFSSAHGHGIKKYKLSRRHVRLLVNCMVTFGMFLIETYIEKKAL
jgi:hypothetical protein